MINEALAEEVRRGEQRKKRSDGTTAAVPETGSAAPEPMAGSAAPELREDPHRTRPESKEENAHEVSIDRLPAAVVGKGRRDQSQMENRGCKLRTCMVGDGHR